MKPLYKVGRVSLHNDGPFVTWLAFRYTTPDFDTSDSSKTGDIVEGTQREVDPAELGVPDGSVIKILSKVAGGRDDMFPLPFLYESGSSCILRFRSSGILPSSTNIDFIGPDPNTNCQLVNRSD